MANYVLAYRGGAMMEDEAERQAEMAKWEAWYGEMGSAVVDGGAPFSQGKLVSAGNVADATDNPLTGYTIVAADGIDGAVSLAQGCPILAHGGSIEVSECIDMSGAQG